MQVSLGDRRFRAALDASPDGFAIYQVITDPGPHGGQAHVTALQLVSINSAGAAGFGGDRDTLIGQDLRDIYPESADNGLFRDLVLAWRTGQPQTTRVRGAAGSWAGVLGATSCWSRPRNAYCTSSVATTPPPGSPATSSCYSCATSPRTGTASSSSTAPRRELSHPVWVDEKALPISASLGLIVANPRGGPDRDRDVAAVLAAADHAMYLGKAAR